METIKIESGCLKVPNKANTWIYRWQDKEGTHVREFYYEGVPQIGDFIIGGNFVEGERPQINNDHRMWIRRKHKSWDDYVWDE